MSICLICIIQVTIVVLTFSNVIHSSSFLEAINDLNMSQNMNFLLLFSIVFSVISIFLVIGYDSILLIVINRNIFKTKIKLSETSLLVIVSNIISLIIGTIITNMIGYSLTSIGFLLSPGTIVKIIVFYIYGIYIQKIWSDKIKVVLLCCIYYFISLALASLILYIVR